MEMFHRLKKEEHVSFWGLLSLVILFFFIAKITVIVREKTEEIRWIICYDI